MEINASPQRLDLDAAHIRRARELGVRFVISTDAHAQDSLDAIRYGVGTARRGWCEARDVVNTLPADRFAQFLATSKPDRFPLRVEGSAAGV